MINKLITKLIPMIPNTPLVGDGDCLRFEVEEDKVLLRFDTYGGQIHTFYLFGLDVLPTYTKRVPKHLKNDLTNALSSACEDWIEESINKVCD